MAQSAGRGDSVRSTENDHSLKKAFTLAEVLITLTVIGVVAAITIGNLVNNYQKHATVAQLKKAQNLISNALEMAEQDYGPSSTWANTEFKRRDFEKKYLDPYFKNVKEIKYNTKNCAGTVHYTGSPQGGASCIDNGICYWTFPSLSATHWNYFYIKVDLNGPKEPNRSGRDIFYFALNGTTRKLTPYAFTLYPNSTREKLMEKCSKEVTGWGGGDGCTALIIRDGWKISDDYGCW